MPSRGLVRLTSSRPSNTSLNTFVVVDYDAFAEALRVIDKRPDVLATIWQGEYCPAFGRQRLPCSCYVSKREMVLRVSSGRWTEPRVRNLLIMEPSAPRSGTSVKRTVDSSQRTVRDFFTAAVAPVNTDVGRAVSPGSFITRHSRFALSVRLTVVHA